MVAGEFDDSALLGTFGAEGLGFFAAPAAISGGGPDLDVHHLGSLHGLQERTYAVSAERRLIHPAVLAILKAAKEEVFQ